ncbi:hypothetical protein HK098_005328 [Nowakowskiella sp. JEL0407]|nr:hypothetical protein HK098_005328 [Nowakowskiella sp. JEL0407]
MSDPNSSCCCSQQENSNGNCCSSEPSKSCHESQIITSQSACKCVSCDCKQRHGQPCAFSLPSLRIRIELIPGSICRCVSDSSARSHCSHSNWCALRDVAKRLNLRVPAVRSIALVDDETSADNGFLVVDVRYASDENSGNISGDLSGIVFEKCKAELLSSGYKSVLLLNPRSVLAKETTNSTIKVDEKPKPKPHINDTSKTTVLLHGLTCSSCVAAIESMLKNIEGVDKDSVVVTLFPQKATFLHSSSIISSQKVAERIEDCGYEVLKVDEEKVYSETTEKTMKKSQIMLSGLTCTSCSSTLESLIKQLPGVVQESVTVTLLPYQKALVIHDSTITTTEDIKTVIEDAGFDVLSDESDYLLPDDNHPSRTKSTLNLKINGMTCNSCVSTIINSVSTMDGVFDIAVHLYTSSAIVVHDPNLVGPRDIISAISSLGFSADLFESNSNVDVVKVREKSENKKLLRMVVISGVLSIPMFLISMVGLMMLPEGDKWRQWLEKDIAGLEGLTIGSLIMFLIATPIQFGVGWKFYKGAWKSLWKMRVANMDVLVVLGTSTAYFFSLYTVLDAMWTKTKPMGTFFETAVFLIFFILFGKYLEVFAKGKTSSAILKLLELQPDTAVLISLDLENPDFIKDETIVKVGLLQVGDIIKVTAGGRIPCDGFLVRGTSYVDESMLTGEPIPVSKKVGDTVSAGTVNQSGLIYIKASRVGSETAISRIIKLVEDAQSLRAPIQAFADKISQFFVPVVVIIAIITLVAWMIVVKGNIPQSWIPDTKTKTAFALEFGIAVLVIACPCALGLATPTAVMVGTGVAAKYGILVKGGGAALENSHQLSIIAFDKTGTLTVGKPDVTDALLFPTNMSTLQQNLIPKDISNLISTEFIIWELLKFVQSTSNHPLSRAIRAHANSIIANTVLVVPNVKKHQRGTSGQVSLVEEIEIEPLELGGTVLSHYAVSDVEEVSGRGICALLKRTSDDMDNLPAELICLVGNEAWMSENGCEFAMVENSALAARSVAEWRKNAASTVYVAVSASFSVKENDSDAKDSASVVRRGDEGLIIGVLSLSDKVRPEAKDVVTGLKNKGLQVWMITGDHEDTAKSVAKRIGIPHTNVLAGVLPGQKSEMIQFLQSKTKSSDAENNAAKRKLGDEELGDVVDAELKPLRGFFNVLERFKKSKGKGLVAMVGDGINDSPALAQADVGIAIGAGSDIAVEAAQIILVKSNLKDVFTLLHLSSVVFRRIRINFGWAFAYNIIGIPLASGVLAIPWWMTFSGVDREMWMPTGIKLEPWMAGLAMALSSVSVVVSSLLLKLYRPPKV